MKKIIKKSIGVLARFYHKLRSIRLVWNLINLKSIFLYKNTKNILSDEQQRIVSDLKKYGIAKTSVDKLFSSDVFESLKQTVEERWNAPEVQNKYLNRHEALDGDKLKNKSFFLVDLWRGEVAIDLNNNFTKFSLSNEILNTVNGYMGMFMRFSDWRLQVTVPMPEGMRSYASQEWHRDPEDQKLVKVFLYLNDVDENAGPFIYLKESHIGGKWRGLSPQQPPRGSASDDSKIPAEDKVVCVGKAGTIIFCDTSGLHRGGHAKKNNRMMYTSVFVSDASVWMKAYKILNSNLESCSRAIKYAVSGKSKKEPKYYQF